MTAKVKTAGKNIRFQNYRAASFENSVEVLPPTLVFSTTSVSGAVRIKQTDRSAAAAGILIEAVRADTREMLGSTETDDLGRFRFDNLPTGTDFVFLVSSPQIRPSIFQAAIQSKMKNIDFVVSAK